jgi:iron(III) transport system permease protein
MTGIALPDAEESRAGAAFRLRWPGRLGLVAWAAAALVAAPVAVLLLIAAQGDAEIWPHLISHVIPAAVRDTALLVLGVSVLSGVIGVGCAWLTAQYEFPGRGWMSWALALPLALPGYLVAYVYADFLSFHGPVQAGLRAALGLPGQGALPFPDVRSLPGAIVVLGLTLYPYAYLSCRAMFASQSACSVEVARTLGASPWRLFHAVGLPLARPAVAAGLALVILETLNDIGASEYLGVRTLTVSIYATWLNRGSLAGAAQIATAMLALVVFALWLEAWSRRQQRFHQSARRQRVLSRQRLEGRGARLASLVCLLPILLGAALPLGLLAGDAAVHFGAGVRDPGLVRALGVTVLLAGGAAAIVVFLGALVAMAKRSGEPGGRPAARIAALGYALPGAVLALGLLTPLATIDNALALAARELFGQRIGLVLIGSGTAIMIAYVIRFLTIGISGAENGLARIPVRVDEAARTLGADAAEVSKRVHWPLLRPSLAASALLVFVDAMKELPATLLLRPLNVDTLATLVYAHAARGSYEEGALAALLIVLAGLYPVARLARRLDPATQPVSS